jgi:hypothetical protein
MRSCRAVTNFHFFQKRLFFIKVKIKMILATLGLLLSIVGSESHIYFKNDHGRRNMVFGVNAKISPSNPAIQKTPSNKFLHITDIHIDTSKLI